MAEYKGCAGCEFQQWDQTCKAFPKGIPMPILSGEVEHTKPMFKQENKVVFKPISEATKKKLLKQL